MVDRVFFYVLLPLPLVMLAAVIVYTARAWQTTTPRLRVARWCTALWLGAAAGVLLFARERVRNWADFDNAFAATVLIGAAALFVLAGFVMAAGALVGRSSRGAALCPRCWYDMTGLAEFGAVCPECGLRVDADADLVRRKRWPVLLALAVAIQLGGQFIYQVVRADNAGLASFVPTTVLVAGMYSLPRDSVLGSGSSYDTETLTARLTDTRTANWQRSWALAKALRAINATSSREDLIRAAAVLNRCRYDGEFKLDDWRGAIRSLCKPGPDAAEALSFLSDCYTRSRSVSFTYRFAPPRDAALSADELRPIVPDLLAHFQNATPRTPEWWATLQLLALCGDSCPELPRYLERRTLSDESDSTRASCAVVLAAISGRWPDAGFRLADAFGSMDSAEQIRLLTFLARNPTSDAALHDLFRAMVASRDPSFEVIGAGGLASSPATRCEGVAKLLMIFEEQRRLGNTDVWSLYPPIVRIPDDDASDELLARIQEAALRAGPDAQVEAMTVLASVGKLSPARNASIPPFFDLLSNVPDEPTASRARNLASDIRSAAQASVPRKYPVIR
ncbi:MAG: hypothetical protein U0573_09595 [Phycisphaerales bacterium]|nr:hypothetical protein [Planctomycetota bacterium]